MSVLIASCTALFSFLYSSVNTGLFCFSSHTYVTEYRDILPISTGRLILQLKAWRWRIMKWLDSFQYSNCKSHNSSSWVMTDLRCSKGRWQWCGLCKWSRITAFSKKILRNVIILFNTYWTCLPTDDWRTVFHSVHTYSWHHNTKSDDILLVMLVTLVNIVHHV